jgi:hypothetical protein
METSFDLGFIPWGNIRLMSPHSLFNDKNHSPLYIVFVN